MRRETSSICRPPTRRELFFDRAFRVGTLLFAWLTILLVVFIVYQIAATAAPAIRSQGTAFFTGLEWNAGQNKFGIGAAIWGTLYSSFLGVAIGTLFGLAVAIFLTEDFLPVTVCLILKNTIALLAAIPSVVYGLWGIFVVIPTLRPVAGWLHQTLGWIPLFSTPLSGPGLLPAALVLAIMVLPTISAISRDALEAVPTKLREAAYGLGATRWEVILKVVLPTASRGIYGAILLAFGRALGETMALAMLIGNANVLSWSLFSPATTLAALIANQFPEASVVERSALLYAALVLLVITLSVNVLGTLILMRSGTQSGGR